MKDSLFAQEGLVEITDSMVAALISSSGTAGRGIRRNPSRGADIRLNRPGTCHCGSCRTCVDNAKWERVFSEKFEDPDYYKSRPMWGASSLASF